MSIKTSTIQKCVVILMIYPLVAVATGAQPFNLTYMNRDEKPLITLDDDDYLRMTGVGWNFITSNRLYSNDFFKIQIVQDIRWICFGVYYDTAPSIDEIDFTNFDSYRTTWFASTDGWTFGSLTKASGPRPMQHALYKVTYNRSNHKVLFEGEMNSTFHLEYSNTNNNKTHYFYLFMMSVDDTPGIVHISHCEELYCKRCNDSATCDECYFPKVLKDGLCTNSCGEGSYPSSESFCSFSLPMI